MLESEDGDYVEHVARAIDEAGWLKALKLGEYAARKPKRPESLQGALFPYLDAL